MLETKKIVLLLIISIGLYFTRPNLFGILFSLVLTLRRPTPTWRGIILVTLIQLLLGINKFAKATTVTIPNQGQVAGLVKTFQNDPNTPYYQYKAIPYANPVGRFELARPKSFWPETHDGTKEGPLCPQISTNPIEEDERNCLRLSITTPQDPNNIIIPLAVLVFIHGGGFYSGNIRSDKCDPEMLAQEGIVVVQLQYRLGATAWVTDTEIIPKNIGLKDIRLGLEFVQKYIGAFGGDPSMVTMYGESAGSIAAANLWQSPRTQHLFRAAYFQSGTNINVVGYQHDPAAAFRRILKGGPCAFSIFGTRKQQVNCLKLLPVQALSISTGLALAWEDVIQLGVINGFTAAVVLEDPSDPEAIVIEKPLKQLMNGSTPTKPVWISITSEEMLLFESLLDVVRFRSNRDLVPRGMEASDPDAVGKAIKIYYGGSELGFNLLPKPKIIRAVSDLCMNNAFRKFIEVTRSKMAARSIYCMQFSYVSAIGNVHKGDLVGHSEELYYTWNMDNKTWQKDRRRGDITEEAYRKQNQLITLVANFVKYLDPTPFIDPALDNFIWPAVSNSNPNVECLKFDKEFGVLVNPKDENYGFWNDIYYSMGNPTATF